MRLPVGLAALALLLASLAVAILFARFLQRGGAGELARLVAERGTIDHTLGRARDAAVPAPDAGPAPLFSLGPEAVTAVGVADDPQREASERSFHGADAGVGAVPFQETWVRGHLRSVDGIPELAVGTVCWARVLPVGGSGYNCLVRVTCDETLLYPDGAQQAGYAPCEVADTHVLRGTDTSTSGRDGDPTLDLDVGARTLFVHDATPVEGDPYFDRVGSGTVRTFSAEITLEGPQPRD